MSDPHPEVLGRPIVFLVLEGAKTHPYFSYQIDNIK